MGRLFGTDGIRGIANEQLSVELALSAGEAAGTVIREKTHKRPKVVIGRDTRLSSGMLEGAMSAGFCAAGCDVFLLGVVPTPAVAFLARQMQADAGVMLTASHNPYMDNGIKIIGGNGFKLSDEEEDEIEAIITGAGRTPYKAPPREVGTVNAAFDAVQTYIDYISGFGSGACKDLKIALDCANGCASVTAPKIFNGLTSQCLLINNEPDGLNVNLDCGSTHTHMLQSFVLKNRCDLGFAFDGDADRLLAVDALGNLVDGDVLMAIFAMDLKKRGLLKNDGLVVTVMSNLGLHRFARDHGIDIHSSRVGDRYVLEEMFKEGCCLGGEQSGHMIFLDDMTTGDGQLSAVHLLDALSRLNRPLHEIRQTVPIYPQVLKNVPADSLKKAQLWRLDDLIRRMNDSLGGEGRVLVRPSGTEAVVRVMVEGADSGQIEKIAQDLVEAIQNLSAG